MRLPLDLSQMSVLIARMGDALFALPATAARSLARLVPSQIVDVDGLLHVRDQEVLVPLCNLAATLALQDTNPSSQGDSRYFVLDTTERVVAFRVDDFEEVDDHIVKPVGDRAEVPLMQAALVMADGRVAPVLNAQDLARRALPEMTTGVVNAPEPPRQRRVLVVDDSVTTRQLVGTILRSDGYAVESVAHAADAWRQIESERFDVLVTDIEMPHMSGFELLHRVRNTKSVQNLPVVLVTGLDRESERRRALDLGANAYIVKARFDQRLLLDTLQALLP
jgi:two-component system chemotaxis sensor kinase CheA